MLAHLAAAPFDSPHHLFEVKWDGVRCVAFLEPTRTRLQSRRLQEITPLYPELAELHRQVRSLPAVLDGEIISVSAGRPDFEAILHRHRLRRPERIAAAARQHPVVYVVFDLLYLAGRSLFNRPLVERKELLAREVRSAGALVVAEFIRKNGRAYARATFAQGLEGIMAKEVHSPYLPGQRSRYWLKVKAGWEVTAAIVGFKARADAPSDLGALALAFYRHGRFAFCGLVGSGFSQEEGERLRKLLLPLRRPEPTAQGVPSTLVKEVEWVQPCLTCRVRFLEQTSQGYLRHVTYLALAQGDPTQCTGRDARRSGYE